MSILIIYVIVVIRWRPNVEVHRTLRIVARLLDEVVLVLISLAVSVRLFSRGRGGSW
jgi:hypothetical protein